MKRFRSYKIKFRVFQYTLSDGPLVKVECVIIVVDLRHVWFQTPSSHSGIQKPSMRKVYESREIVVFLKTDFTFWLQTLHLELWANYVQGVKRKTKKTKTKNKQKKAKIHLCMSFHQTAVRSLWNKHMLAGYPLLWSKPVSIHDRQNKGL